MKNKPTNKRAETVAARVKNEKQRFLEQLRKTPVVQIAARECSIGRTTYYAWRASDKTFAQAADQAIRSGRYLVNDIAESQLISLVREKKFEAIRYWLSKHHKDYTEKLIVQGDIDHRTTELTNEQKKAVRAALRLTLKNRMYGKTKPIPKTNKPDTKGPGSAS